MDAIIVDDDVLTRDIIESYAEKTNFVRVIKKCSDPLEASEVLRNEKADLVFLDVMMPEMSGIDLVKNFGESKPLVIMITTDKSYASDAFDLDVTDFLLKPISFPRFLKAVSKARDIYESKIIPGSDENIFIKSHSRLVKINSRDIFLIEAMADYVAVHTTQKKYIIHTSMKSIESKLSAHDFIRVHNSYIARLDQIAEIEDGTLTLHSKIIPVSRAHRKKLIERLKLL